MASACHLSYGTYQRQITSTTDLPLYLCILCLVIEELYFKSDLFIYILKGLINFGMICPGRIFLWKCKNDLNSSIHAVIISICFGILI